MTTFEEPYRIMVSGHRPDKLGIKGHSGYRSDGPLRVAVRDTITERLIEAQSIHKDLRAISGMALGVDQDFAQCCVDLGIPFTAAIPCVDQARMWKKHDIINYNRLCELAAKIVFVSREIYTNRCMQERNKWMCDHADAMLAVWDGSAGGTRNCINYAIKHHLPISYIKVDQLRQELLGQQKLF